MTPEQLEKEAKIIGEIFCLPNRDHHLPCPMVDYILASLRAVHDEARVEGAHAEFNAHRLGFIEGVNEALETAARTADKAECTCGVWSGVVASDIRALKITKDEL